MDYNICKLIPIPIDPKVASYHTKIVDNFSNYFCKQAKAKFNYFIVQNYTHMSWASKKCKLVWLNQGPRCCDTWSNFLRQPGFIYISSVVPSAIWEEFHRLFGKRKLIQLFHRLFGTCSLGYLGRNITYIL